MTVGPNFPDYSRPSIDVQRRADTDWQWGVTHTVRPEKLAPMLPDVEYSITVKVQRTVTELHPDTTFTGLYTRATTIAVARCHDFAREDEGVHHWIMCQAWRTVPAGSSSLVFAMVMMGLTRPTAGQMPPLGEPAPTTQELTTSGGATMEEMQHRSPQRATEVFVEFDHRHPAAGGTPLFTYSYGERVAVNTVDSFEPFVRRAENHARAHEALFDMPGTSVTPSSIRQREWYIADNLVTVELHLKA
ncbi:MAG: hypothetical protein WBC51_01670 [Vicinamibacterales bacterium]